MSHRQLTDDHPPGVVPEWRIANSAIVKIVATLLLLYVTIKLAPLFILLALAILLACMLYPAIRILERHMPHWMASLVVTLVVISVVVGTVLGVIPTLIEQFSIIVKQLPEMEATVLKSLPPGAAQRAVQHFFQNPVIPTEHVFSAGQYIFGSISELALIVALALYLAADGKRTYAWLRAFFSRQHRAKIDETAREASDIIVAYVVGQLVTSVLCGVFVFVVLQLLHVPAALVLAVLAAAFDVLPMLGFFLFTVPAVLFSATVSSGTALTVLALYVAYHIIENYLIVPKVYGNRLRLSDLVVLTAVLAGTLLGGIAGAVLILPLVAAYSAFERIWLVEYVGRDVIEKHEAVENAPA